MLRCGKGEKIQNEIMNETRRFNETRCKCWKNKTKSTSNVTRTIVCQTCLLKTLNQSPQDYQRVIS